jgi:hypothetical protein
MESDARRCAERTWDLRWQGAPPRPNPPVRGPSPDDLSDAELAHQLRIRLLGRPLEDTPAPEPTSAVVWVDAGDEVLVHRDSLKIRLTAGVMVVSVDVETTETGREHLAVPLALAISDKPVTGASGLFAVTSREPYAHPQLVARWGRILQDAVWGGLLTIAVERAARRGLVPSGISIDLVKNRVRLHAKRRNES